jgi:magnesium chelatase family protein
MADLPATLASAVDATVDAMRERVPIVYVGPPGVGATMIARRITSMLPPLSEFDSGRLTERYRRNGMCTAQDRIVDRPFRAPHHSVSDASMGTIKRRPGEVELAECGVLYLDELPEFRRSTLSAVDVVRREVIDVWLIASAHRCACGWLGSTARECVCGDESIDRYAKRLDSMLAFADNWRRIDLPHIDMNYGDGRCQSSSEYRERFAA